MNPPLSKFCCLSWSKLKQKIDWAETGGAPLLGVNGGVDYRSWPIEGEGDGQQESAMRYMPRRAGTSRRFETPHTTFTGRIDDTSLSRYSTRECSGRGSYVPTQIVTNDDLARRIETSDEWIRTRSGIRERRIAAPDVATSDLAVEAGRRALANADLTPLNLDLIIVATCTPDHPGSFPSTAAIVQNALGATKAGAFDLGAVCSGFAYSLHVAAQMIASGAINKALVIGAETLSRITNWDDRNTAVLLFGDGQLVAVVLGPVDQPGISWRAICGPTAPEVHC